MVQTVDLLVDAQNAVGESPVWCGRSQCLFWVDIERCQLWRWEPLGWNVSTWALPEMLGCIAPHHSGGWVLAMQSGVYWLRDLPDPGPIARSQLAPLAPAAHDPARVRFNDGRCDPFGRFLAGTMPLAPSLAAEGTLTSLTGGTALRALLQGIHTPNGLAFSPDGRTMYFSDSHPSARMVWAFDYDPDSGTPSNRRVFVDMRSQLGRPDGAAVDTDGCYWICGNDAGEVYRYTPQGRLDQTITVPVAKPSMCAFGGAKLDTLYITSIAPRSNAPAAAPQLRSLAGAVFVCKPGAQGLPADVFKP